MHEVSSASQEPDPLDRRRRLREKLGRALGQAAGFTVGLTATLTAAGFWLSSCSPTIESDPSPGAFSESHDSGTSQADDFVVDYAQVNR